MRVVRYVVRALRRLNARDRWRRRIFASLPPAERERIHTAMALFDLYRPVP